MIYCYVVCGRNFKVMREVKGGKWRVRGVGEGDIQSNMINIEISIGSVSR